MKDESVKFLQIRGLSLASVGIDFVMYSRQVFSWIISTFIQMVQYDRRSTNNRTANPGSVERVGVLRQFLGCPRVV